MADKVKHPILVVDDEAEILFSLQSLLRHEFEVHTAEGGAKALEALRWTPVHVILTDQRMPGMTGVEFLSQAQVAYPQAVRVIFTGYADIKAVIDAVNHGGIFRYLTKPWEPAELIAVLHQACEYYDAITERAHLLADLRGFATEGLALPQVPAGGKWAMAGKALVERIDRTLKAPK